jgi:hypothetical protein
MRTMQAIRKNTDGIQFRVHIKHDPEYDIYELWVYHDLEQEPRYKKMYKTYRGVSNAYKDVILKPAKKYFK